MDSNNVNINDMKHFQADLCQKLFKSNYLIKLLKNQMDYSVNFNFGAITLRRKAVIV